MTTVRKEFDAVSWRPTVAGRKHAAASGHYLATLAAQRVLDGGGNAIDAGVAAAMALAVLQPDLVSFAGVAPTLIYLQSEQRVVSLAGLGYWPAATDVDRLRREGQGVMPEGILRTVLPAAPATHIEALRRWGTISFEQAAMPAFELASEGFYLYPFLRYDIEANAQRYDRYPENRSIFRPGGTTPPVGALFRQENLARTLYRLITGRVPFEGGPHRVAAAEGSLTTKLTVGTTIPRGLAKILERMLALRPEDRLASAAEVERELAKWARRAELPELVAEVCGGPRRPSTGQGSGMGKLTRRRILAAGATAVAAVMLVVSFVLLLIINLLQAWTARSSGRAR